VNVLALLDVLLSILQATLTGLGANDKYRKVASEIQGAVGSISRARQEVLTNSQLESLRTSPQW